ncbi:MAG TPA: hypothetical protein VLS89_19470, partial [Candidatus Nanopelagicales bacterium]|nr:hypothetical protein [Candidatus Nanopelagicales bacterium]
MTRPDVLILTALQDELEAVLALGEGAKQGWKEKRDGDGFRYHLRKLPGAYAEPLVIAAAWTGDMAEPVTVLRAQQLIEELKPACLAMCGICAGYRKDVALGDVIVADRVYGYDLGKVVAGE